MFTVAEPTLSPSLSVSGGRSSPATSLAFERRIEKVSPYATAKKVAIAAVAVLALLGAIALVGASLGMGAMPLALAAIPLLVVGGFGLYYAIRSPDPQPTALPLMAWQESQRAWEWAKRHFAQLLAAMQENVTRWSGCA